MKKAWFPSLSQQVLSKIVVSSIFTFNQHSFLTKTKQEIRNYQLV